ncbi:MAG: hypothetical protein ABJC26_14220 [Gemmatimonadaceae bacterium]
MENSEGTALIEFTGYGERTASYRWRAHTINGALGRGSGALVERFVPSATSEPSRTLDVQKSDLLIAAGPVNISWSYANMNSGWLYVDRKNLHTDVVPASEIETYAFAQ